MSYTPTATQTMSLLYEEVTVAFPSPEAEALMDMDARIHEFAHDFRGILTTLNLEIHFLSRSIEPGAQARLDRLRAQVQLLNAMVENLVHPR